MGKKQLQPVDGYDIIYSALRNKGNLDESQKQDLYDACIQRIGSSQRQMLESLKVLFDQQLWAFKGYSSFKDWAAYECPIRPELVVIYMESIRRFGIDNTILLSKKQTCLSQIIKDDTIVKIKPEDKNLLLFTEDGRQVTDIDYIKERNAVRSWSNASVPTEKKISTKLDNISAGLFSSIVDVGKYVSLLETEEVVRNEVISLFDNLESAKNRLRDMFPRILMNHETIEISAHRVEDGFPAIEDLNSLPFAERQQEGKLLSQKIETGELEQYKADYENKFFKCSKTYCNGIGYKKGTFAYVKRITKLAGGDGFSAVIYTNGEGLESTILLADLMEYFEMVLNEMDIRKAKKIFIKILAEEYSERSDDF